MSPPPKTGLKLGLNSYTVYLPVANKNSLLSTTSSLSSPKCLPSLLLSNIPNKACHCFGSTSGPWKAHVWHKVLKVGKKEGLFDTCNLLNPPLHQACIMCHSYLIPTPILSNIFIPLSQASPVVLPGIVILSKLSSVSSVAHPQWTFPTHFMVPLSLSLPSRYCSTCSIDSCQASYWWHCLSAYLLFCPSPTAWSCSEGDIS